MLATIAWTSWARRSSARNWPCSSAGSNAARAWDAGARLPNGREMVLDQPPRHVTRHRAGLGNTAPQQPRRRLVDIQRRQCLIAPARPRQPEQGRRDELDPRRRNRIGAGALAQGPLIGRP